MKLNINDLTEPKSESLPMTGNDDFLSRVNTTISNFKELLVIAQQVRGVQGDISPGHSPAPSAEGINKAVVLKFIDIIIQKGYGDATIGNIISEVSPITINQVKEFIKRA